MFKKLKRCFLRFFRRNHHINENSMDTITEKIKDPITEKIKYVTIKRTSNTTPNQNKGLGRTIYSTSKMRKNATTEEINYPTTEKKDQPPRPKGKPQFPLLWLVLDNNHFCKTSLPNTPSPATQVLGTTLSEAGLLETAL